jgi:hypothetical protein
MFTASPENVATEALNYILNRSSVAKHAFLQYCKQAELESRPFILPLFTQLPGRVFSELLLNARSRKLR